MYRHVAVFSWKPEATEEQRRTVAERLMTLPGVIPELHNYRVGPDAGFSPDNADFAVVADFADADAYYTYRDHPAHHAIIDAHIAPIIASRTAVQFELDR